MKVLLISLINVYQKYLSVDTGLFAFLFPFGVCKYRESCSSYAKRMIKEQGSIKGLILGGKRFITCI